MVEGGNKTNCLYLSQHKLIYVREEILIQLYKYLKFKAGGLGRKQKGNMSDLP